jgi:hypothetical protein
MSLDADAISRIRQKLEKPGKPVFENGGGLAAGSS